VECSESIQAWGIKGIQNVKNNKAPGTEKTTSRNSQVKRAKGCEKWWKNY
jgi:hypothetical protein